MPTPMVAFGVNLLSSGLIEVLASMTGFGLLC